MTLQSYELSRKLGKNSKEEEMMQLKNKPMTKVLNRKSNPGTFSEIFWRKIKNQQASQRKHFKIENDFSMKS